MGAKTAQSIRKAFWELVRRQHGVVARRQLLELGFTPKAIDHRMRTGRLHPVFRGVYAVGRPDLGRLGIWMAAVLTAGPGAALSHGSGAALWEIRDREGDRIEVSVSILRAPRCPDLTVHRRTPLDSRDVVRRLGIPVTSPACTLVDLAARLPRDPLEAAINEADKRDLIKPDALRKALHRFEGRPGVAVLRRTLDSRTFVLSDSRLERLFMPLVRGAGLPRPLTKERVNGFEGEYVQGVLVAVAGRLRTAG
jgi:hypothetical protein